MKPIEQKELPVNISLDTNLLIKCFVEGKPGEGNSFRKKIAKICEVGRAHKACLVIHQATFDEWIYKLKDARKKADKKLTPKEKTELEELIDWCETLRNLLELKMVRGKHPELNIIYGNPIIYTPAAEAEAIAPAICNQSPDCSGELRDAILVAFAAKEKAIIFSEDNHIDSMIRTIKGELKERGKGKEAEMLYNLAITNYPFPLHKQKIGESKNLQNPLKSIKTLVESKHKEPPEIQ